MTNLAPALQPQDTQSSARKPPDHPTAIGPSSTSHDPPLPSGISPHDTSLIHPSSRETVGLEPQADENSNPAGIQVSRQHRFSLSHLTREKVASPLATLGLRNKTSSSSLQPSHYTKSPLPTTAAATSSFGSKQTDPNLLHPAHVARPSSDLETRATPGVQAINSSRKIIDQSGVPDLNPDSAPVDRRPPVTNSPSTSRTPSPDSYLRQSLNKMHQTSSRLLRMTDEERPFTRDFMDLFSTLMVSLPLSPHRIRFQKVEHTFTSEEAINNLGSLKFSQSNRMPDPKDPSRIVTTTTTTTFSMAKEMARSVCQRFMDARFIESADGKLVSAFSLKGSVWQLTPKGMHVLTMFCQRNGINQRHILDVLDSPRNTMQLVILEREGTTDKLSHDRATVEVIFRRFAGQDGPNLKSSTSTSDSDSLSDYYNGLIGVKMASERKILDRIVANTFTGKAGVDWLMDCCTTVDRRESYEVAELFVQHGLIWAVVEDKVYIHQNAAAARFQPTKNAIYGLTDKGQVVAGWLNRENLSNLEPRNDAQNKASIRADARNGHRDSNTSRLTVIVNDAALRLLFREYLRDTHCEENLAFYLEVREFTKSYDKAERDKAFVKLDAIRESLAAAYGK